MMTLLFENSFANVTASRLGECINTEPYLSGLTIQHKLCQAKVSLYGGQVLSFVPNGQKEIFWLSDDALYQQGKAIRGGIPLCWPWFGGNDQQTSQQSAPNHGFARQSVWLVKQISADPSGITLILELKGENQHPLWPHAYQLTQTLFFGETFKQSLTIHNLSAVDVQYSAALHSYFRVSNPENIQLPALTGINYYDKLTDSNAKQDAPISCVGEIDREYHSSEMMVFVDQGWQRKLIVTSQHCQQWVLWNPGKELAESMGDVHQGGEREYVCLEAANTQWQTLIAGGQVTIGQTVEVRNTGP